MRVFDLRSTLPTHLGIGLQLGYGKHDVLNCGSPNLGGEFHWWAEGFHVLFRLKSVWWSRGRWSRIKSSHGTFSFILWHISANARHWIFFQFFQCRWQHSKAYSFTCHCWLFFWQGCRPILHQARKGFCKKSGKVLWSTFYSVYIYIYTHTHTHTLATRVVWPTMRWTFVNLSPRDASLFAKNRAFCGSTSCCFFKWNGRVLGGHQVTSTTWHLSSFCLSPLFLLHNMMGHRGCTFEGAARADRQTLLLEPRPFQEERVWRICTLHMASNLTDCQHIAFPHSLRHMHWMLMNETASQLWSEKKKTTHLVKMLYSNSQPHCLTNICPSLTARSISSFHSVDPFSWQRETYPANTDESAPSTVKYDKIFGMK